MSTEATSTAEHGPLVRALGAACGALPPTFLAFARVAEGRDRKPGFTEHSVRMAGAIDPFRLTHYFDVIPGEQGIAALRDVSARFLELGASFGYAIDARLRSAVGDVVPELTQIEQIVLGIDARKDAAHTRLKCYLVFREPAPDDAARIWSTLGVTPLPALNPSEVRIIGVDLGPQGLVDVKVYVRLDRARVARTARNFVEFAALLEASREVVLQQCLIDTSRRQLHFHATDARDYAEWLDARAATDATFAALTAHGRSVEAHLDGTRLEPSIIGLEHREGLLRAAAGNVYFHPTTGPTPRRRPR